jgi:bifunctional non-homologous end joining protein LigD
VLSEKDVRPMLCQLADGKKGVGRSARLDDPKMLYELKLDGVRIVAMREGAKVKLIYRSSRDASKVYPEIGEALAKVSESRFVLDGEVVALGPDGRPSFELLQQRIAAEAGDVAAARKRVPVAYLVFDALSVGGEDVRKQPLEARKQLVRELLPERSIVAPHEGHVGRGRAIFDLCIERGLEGVVGKRLGSPYRPGERTSDWIKWKTYKEDDFVVVGFTRGEGSRKALGALDLASFDGDRLVVRGKAGSGLSEATLALLAPVLGALACKEPRAEGPWEREARTYVEPVLVVKVRYFGWSSDGHLRGPVFLGIREDGNPRDCRVAPTPP